MVTGEQSPAMSTGSAVRQSCILGIRLPMYRFRENKPNSFHQASVSLLVKANFSS